jgi:excisionase family DNA binding protein
MTAQPRRHHDRRPRPADLPRRTSGPPPSEGDVGAGIASRAGRDSRGGRLTSVGEAARLIGLSRDVLYHQIRPGNLAYVKVGTWWCLITRHHLPQFLGIAP